MDTNQTGNRENAAPTTMRRFVVLMRHQTGYTMKEASGVSEAAVLAMHQGYLDARAMELPPDTRMTRMVAATWINDRLPIYAGYKREERLPSILQASALEYDIFYNIVGFRIPQDEMATLDEAMSILRQHSRSL